MHLPLALTFLIRICTRRACEEEGDQYANDQVASQGYASEKGMDGTEYCPHDDAVACAYHKRRKGMGVKYFKQLNIFSEDCDKIATGLSGDPCGGERAYMVKSQHPDIP